MFVSASSLGIQYGVDDKIARFFVDREPPLDNLYWKDKLLYLRPEVGWLFIPLTVDLFHKLGISREQLLSEQFVGLLEAVGHISALEESRQINEIEAKERANQLVFESCLNKEYLNDLNDYFKDVKENYFANLVSPFVALHRGDLFLFSLCGLSANCEVLFKLVEHWFALITTLLLLDDAEDFENDKLAGEKNAFVECELLKDGGEKIFALVRSNLKKLAAINRSLAVKLDIKLKEVYKKPQLQFVINSAYGAR